MDKKLLTKWINALESGEYKQARQQLKKTAKQRKTKEPAYCCLGVLCEVAKVEYNPEAPFPPSALTKSLGLETWVKSRDTYTTPRSDLIEMNDTERKTFKTIAKRLRAYRKTGVWA